MSSLALLFVGAVLLVNGLVLLGRVESRAAIPINLLAGAGLVTASLLIAIPGEPDRAALFGAVGYALFGVTYLTVAGTTLLRADLTGLGWYCAWAAVVAIILAVVNFAADDSHLAWLWVSWAVLFAAFFLACCRAEPVFTVAAGVVAVGQSVTTASVPALLMIDGSWSDLAIGWVIGANAGCVVAAVVLATGRRVPSARR